QKSVLDKMKAQFMKGATAKGHPADTLEKIWTDWEAFAQYAFNKSHSTCYALVAYQTAYLKAHYPSEYMAAVLNHAGAIDKITFYMEECKRMGITVLGCDINESQKGFAPNKKGEIRFGFGGVKGVGDAAIDSILEEREKGGVYTDIFDFIKRVNQRTVNKKSLESLVYAGAFDCFDAMHRAQFFAIQPGETVNNLERIVKFGNVYQTGAQSTANSLFGDMGMPEVATPKILPSEVWSLIEKLNFEKEVTGIYISGHPLDNYKFEMEHYGIVPLSTFNEVKDNMETQPNTSIVYRLAGLVTEAAHRLTKTGREFGILTIEDFSGKTEIALWRDDYVKYKSYIDKGLSVVVNGFFIKRFNGESFDFKVTSILLLETLKTSCTKSLELELPLKSINENRVNFFRENMKKNPGTTTLKFKVIDMEEEMLVSLYTLDKGVIMNEELIEYLNRNQEIGVYVGLTG
ncbi:OB-fold nucleic acid binding domain-containing protein, partial [Arachidicoccus sp.]|uniref:helix-hairpin-helix domain-containing protein n=1 Tax=Arachidicoccus sp. TaxID=1872624 RepID=UPI003D1D8689